MSVELEAKGCPSCGLVYGVPKDWMAAKSRQHDRGEDVRWFCPNGHETVFAREAESIVLKRERDRLKQEVARLEEEKRDIAAFARSAMSEAKRVHRRAVAGVCPCCNRSFRQLSAHMRNKHPKEQATLLRTPQAKGGEARAAAMTPERRRAVAKEAAHKRWHGGAHG